MPFILNPLTGKFDYYQSSTGSQGVQGIQGMPGQNGEDGEDGLMGPPGAAGLPATPGNAAYGEMVIINNATGLAMTLQNTAYQVVSGWQVDDTNGFTFAGSALTTQTSGAFLTTCSVSVQSTSSNQVYNFQIYRNGVAIPGHNAICKLTNSSDVNSITLVGTIDSVNKNDVFTLWATNQASAGQTLTVSYANFSITAIQGATGLQGIQGVPGLSGEDGEDGQIGPPGIPGIQGIAGTNGTNGAQGIPGLIGIPGQDGEDGEPGQSIIGPQGIQGVQGNPGANGTIGRDGAPGQAGEDGEDGGIIFIPVPPATSSGVSQIIAGTNVTISPVGGTGAVTINAAGGAGGNWPTVQNSTLVTDTVTIAAGFQLIVGRTFNNVGALINNGDLVII
jgi:hypothetical protein